MRAIAERYQLIQFGISFFVLDSTKAPEKHYLGYPFNVYLFPEEGHGMQYNITLDIETACFHKQQKLDFNKWIYQGIPYLNERAEKALMAKLNEIKSNEKEELQLSEDEKKRVGICLDGLKKWIDEGAKDEYVITDLNGFLRKYVYQKVEELYPDLYAESKQKGKFEKDIIFKRLSEEDKKTKKNVKAEEELKEIQRKSGARKLFLLIKSAKFPIIGHNALFDLLFIYSHFHDDLPHEYSEFKSRLLQVFPTYLLFQEIK